jgi:hypothetical protein
VCGVVVIHKCWRGHAFHRRVSTIRLGTRTENRVPLIRDFVALAQLDDLVFGAWLVFADDAYVNAFVAEKIT